MVKQSETNIWKSAQLFVCRFGDGLSRLMRNQRYKGKGITRSGEVWLDCGVGGDGGHDVLGWHSFVIRPEHVGKRIAQYLSIETKTKGGRKSVEQKDMAEIVRKAGGLTGFARSDEEVEKILKDW